MIWMKEEVVWTNDYENRKRLTLSLQILVSKEASTLKSVPRSSWWGGGSCLSGTFSLPLQHGGNECDPIPWMWCDLAVTFKLVERKISLKRQHKWFWILSSENRESQTGQNYLIFGLIWLLKINYERRNQVYSGAMESADNFSSLFFLYTN